jgi:dienelactone hydrolase
MGRVARSSSILAFLLGAVLTLATACGGGDEDARPATPPAPARSLDASFYVPPSPLPAGRPGDVLRARSLQAPAGARAWGVLYRSRGVDGRDVAVSGLVVAPARAAPPGGFPVVAWAHGTVGVADRCAPSRSARDRSLPLPSLWDSGYVVVATDYQGLGTPGDHLYLVGTSEARGVLDGIRAAGHLEGAHASDSVVLTGLSQGGHAALFAGEQASAYAPELHVRGVVAVAPASELERMVELADAGPLRGIAAVVADAYASAYPDIDRAATLTPEARRWIVAAKQACVGTPDVAAPKAATIQPGAASSAVWQSRLAENTPGRRATAAPILLVHGTADDQVPVELSQLLLARLCAHGERVDLRLYPGAHHGDVVIPSLLGILQWIDSRFRGDQAPSSCGAG